LKDVPGKRNVSRVYHVEEGEEGMVDIRVEFVWEVPQAGSRWVEEGRDGSSGSTFTLGQVFGRDMDHRPPWLIGPPLGTKVEVVSYHPLEESPELHRTFAALPMEREAILEFVRRHGPLTKGLVLVEERGEEPLRIYRGEPWYFWLREIQDMRDAVLLFDLVGGRNGAEPVEEALRQVIVWREDGVYCQPWEGELESLYKDLLGYRESAAEAVKRLALTGEGDLEGVKKKEKFATKLGQRISALLRERGRFSLSPKLIASPAFHPEEFRAWRKGKDVVGPARLLLSRLVSEKLVGKVDIRLAADAGGVELILAPRDLLSALWTGLLFEILGKVRLKRCPICGAFFDAGSAPQRVFCTSRGSGCRQLAYRWRRKLHFLLREGKSLAEAAQVMGIDLSLAEFLVRRGRGNQS